MCFSATGSFGAAAVLAGLGGVAFAQTKPSSHRVFALTPLLFAVQQVSEGVVWLTINPDGSRTALHQVAVAAFLVFAVVVWPSWVPLSLSIAERSPGRKKALRVFFAVGACVSAYASWLLIKGGPTAHVAGHSIAYSYSERGGHLVEALYLPAYVLTSVVPFVVSSMRQAKVMGVVLAAALVATFIIKRQTLTSTWCFFAAILSGIIILSLSNEQGDQKRRTALLASSKPA